jgi:raffinose/stachyose/melibiose transport system substrate-binding protein
MRKKVVSLVMCLLTSIAVFAGGVTEKGVEPKEVKITVWYQSDTEKVTNAYEMIVAQFEKEHPGVVVESQVMDNNSIKNGMSTAIPSGLGPDILGGSIGANMWDVVSSGLLYNLTDAYQKYGWLDRIVPWAQPYIAYKDNFYTLPNEAEIVSVYFYNKKIFTENGLKVPETWDEFITLCDTLESLGYEQPIAAPGAVTLFNSHWEAMSYCSSVAKAKIDDTYFNLKSWDQPEFLHAIELLKDINDKAYWGENINAVQYAEALSLFVTGECPIYINGTWVIGDLDKYQDFDYDFFLPPVEPGIEQKAAINCGSGWQVSANSKHPDLAIEFLNMIVSASSDKIWLENCSVIPATRIDTTNLNLTKMQKKIVEITSNSQATYSLYNILPSAVNTATWAKMQEMYQNKATPQDVIDVKQKMWQKEIDAGKIPFIK